MPPMTGFREFVVSILPGPLHSALRPWWRRFFRFRLRVRDWWAPFIVWSVWLVFQCARHRRRAVIICRFGGMGDVICTLPICDEVRRRHPGKLLVFVTAAFWREVVILSQCADLVYANNRWAYPFILPTNVKLFGLVDTIYNPQTTGERSYRAGMTCHLIEDLAASCGFTITARQPRLYPSADLIKKTRIAHGLDCRAIGERLLIGINPGPAWPVKEWEASNWQSLVNQIHSEYDAVIIQFGTSIRDGLAGYDKLTGVQLVTNRRKGEEIVALIAICDLIISIDSGPVHLAGAVGTPLIGLFGALDPRTILPPESPALGLFSDVPCLFCHNRTPVINWLTGCPNDIACMKNLGCETVFEAVKSVLSHRFRSDRPNPAQIQSQSPR